MAVDHTSLMAFDALEKIGVHLDDSNALRLLDPDIAGPTNELKNEMRQFVDSKSNYTVFDSSSPAQKKLGNMMLKRCC